MTTTWAALQIVILGILLAVIGMVAAVPPRIRHRVWRNCRGPNGCFSVRHLVVECQDAGGILFVMSVLFVAAMLPFAAATLIVHETILPLPIVTQALGQFHPNRGEWKDRLTRSDAGVSKDYEQQLTDKGYELETARSVQHFFWKAWIPIAVIGGIGFWLIFDRIAGVYGRTIRDFDRRVAIRWHQRMQSPRIR